MPHVVSFGTEALDEQLREGLAETVAAVDRAMDELAFHKALTSIWGYVGLVNRYVDSTGPWALAKDPEKARRLDQVLYNACEALRAIGLLIFPFMPNSGREIWRRLAVPRAADEGRLEDLHEWGGLPAGTQTDRGQSLFPRIDRP